MKKGSELVKGGERGAKRVGFVSDSEYIKVSEFASRSETVTDSRMGRGNINQLLERKVSCFKLDLL